MSQNQVCSQYRWNPPLADDFWMSNTSQDAYAVPDYRQRTQCQGYYQKKPPYDIPHVSQNIATRRTSTSRQRNLDRNSAMNTHVTAYEDVVITKSWLEEWEAEPDEFGTSWPIALLNRHASIDLENQAWRTKCVQLCYWDHEHEPDGAIAQRLARQARIRHKGQRFGHVGSEQDKRRKRVRLASRNAEVIDLTQDDAAGNGNFQSHVGFENAENQLSGDIARPWGM
jgi:hypothetical protein